MARILLHLLTPSLPALETLQSETCTHFSVPAAVCASLWKKLWGTHAIAFPCSSGEG